MGPLLFIIFINDLDETTSQICAMNKFADDTKVAHIINSRTDHAILQDSLEALCGWGMQFNEEKM